MNYIKVKDKDHLMRDVVSNGIVNNDIEGYKQYEENYKRTYNSLQRINNLEDSISNIKNDLNEIKILLRNLSNESR